MDISTITQLVLGYGFAFALFVGLPAILFVVVFLPGLMRTTGEGIGRQEALETQAQATSLKVPFRTSAPRPSVRRTMMNTA